MTAPLLPMAQRLRLRENQLFLTLAILVGVIAGLMAVLFTLSIDWASQLFFGAAPSLPRLVLVPALVSVVTGILLVKVFPGVRGSGVPQTEAAYRLSGGVIPPRVPIGKFITGVLCIGCGHSIGREGPSVQIGGGIASVIGRWMRLPPSRVRSLVPVGAAAALAAAFNTPLAAVLFSLEEIIGDMNAGLLGSTVVASVAAAVVERSLLGNQPLFHVPAYRLVHPAELGVYAVLGVIGGILSLAFCKGLLRLRAFFLQMPERTRIYQPAMGGLAIGLILLVAPEVRGVGYEHVDQVLNGGVLIQTMVLLTVMKLVATVVSYASGNAGGIFAPTLYIGAMAGGAVGMLVHQFAPFPTASPGAYALVGMGTLFAGIIRAPMTSVFMVFEITQDYQIVVPLMVANLLAFAISRRYQPTPVYHALLEQDHVHLPGPTTVTPVKRIRAREVMSRDVRFVAPETEIAQAWQHVTDRDEPALFVGTRERLLGIVSADRLKQAIASDRGSEPIGSVVVDGWRHVHADHPLETVLERFQDDLGLLPVVSRIDDRRVDGVITLDAIVRLVRRARRQESDKPLPT